MTTATETVSLTSIAQSNPTLNDLIWLVKEHNDYFTDLDLAVLDYYEKSAKNASNRSYYLYGQVPISPDEPITPELLLQADDMTSDRFHEYGGPVNSFEASSIRHSKTLYQNLILIIERYESVYHELMYAPGTGFLFLQANRRFEVNK